MHAMEQINRQTWRKPLSLRSYKQINGYLDDGERTVLEIASRLAFRGRVLDIGVGGGRTTGLLKDMAGSYLGIDYTPEMVDIARDNHPERRFEWMDARNLSDLKDGAFDLAVFSYNGLDSVDPEGRIAVLAEVQRVLAPGGLFVFSTFHRNWSGFENRSNRGEIPWSANPLRLGLRYARQTLGAIRARQRRALEQRQGEHAILLHPAHYFGIMVYATTPQQLTGQLATAGFAPDPMMFDETGAEMGASASADVQYFYAIARKPLKA